MKLGWIVASLAVALPCSAAADWQYTKWGMSPAQVAQASKGALKPCDATCDRRKIDGENPKLIGAYKSGEFNFTAYALFKSDRLFMVLLQYQGDNPYALAAAMRSKYGEPENKGTRDVLTWRDAKDQIQMVTIAGKTDLIYRPRLTDSNKGL